MDPIPPTRIVASIMPRDVSELRQLRDSTRQHADLFEVRADRWSGSADDLAVALAQLGREAIVAVRPKWQGGDFGGSEVERITLLRAAARTASYIDVELRSAFATMAFAPAKKIISTHDFEGTPDDLERMAAELRSVAPDAAFAKLATTTRSLAEVVRLLRLRDAPGAGPPLVPIGMGEAGLPTRLLAGRLGIPLVYGHPPGAGPTAPGQQDVLQLAELYRVREQRPDTAVCVVVGNPISHSLGPQLHNTLYGAARLDRVFVPLLAETLEEALAFADAFAFDGLSVTLPFKVAAARAAVGALPGFPWPPPEGAVNTLKRGARGWLAANTDRAGLLATLERGAPELLVRGRKALVLGAGGAARTAVSLLVERGLAVSIAARTFAHAEALARELGGTAMEATPSHVARFDLIVNATPVGMQPDEGASPLPDGALRRGQVVLDFVYRPRRTRLLAQAEAACARALDGVELFLAQALAQFQIFTGQAADPALARATIERALG
jgi:3-dehydroquinate dehydratase/shikimate dehydrogenase